MDDLGTDSSEVLCDNNTSFVTRPLMIGKVEDLALPFVATMPQAVLFIATFLVLLTTYHFWGAVASVTSWVKLPALFGVPFVVARTLSNPRVEGRPVMRTFAGYLRLFFAPSVWSNDRSDSRSVESVHISLPVVVEPRRGQR